VSTLPRAMTFDPARFRSILGRFASGVTVVTTRDESGRDHGMTVSAFCSLSLEPPLVLACVDRTTEMHAILSDASTFAANILSEEQEALSRRFSEKMDDRFDGVGFRRGVTGAALLDDVSATLECNLVDRHEGGDHTIYVGEVIAGDPHEPRPLVYYRGGYTALER
jgi:flavin reductase (DIM6/NTAB) family NADH-FMN oxidoreductase RutF